MTFSIQLEPMTQEGYAAYRVSGEADYARNLTRSGAMGAVEARAKAAADMSRLLPDGLATKEHHLWTVHDGDEQVGVLLIRLEQRSDGLHAFGHDFHVREDLRRGGYGTAILQAAEKVCRELGVTSVGLHVFGFNIGARALYEQLGFEVTQVQMQRKL